jgi:hypothetical protein
MRMTTDTKIRQCLTKWMSDTQLFLEMRGKFGYTGSPCTLARQRREVCANGGIMSRPLINKKGVKYKQFKAEK